MSFLFFSKMISLLGRFNSTPLQSLSHKAKSSCVLKFGKLIKGLIALLIITVLSPTMFELYNIL